MHAAPRAVTRAATRRHAPAGRARPLALRAPSASRLYSMEPGVPGRPGRFQPGAMGLLSGCELVGHRLWLPHGHVPRHRRKHAEEARRPACARWPRSTALAGSTASAPLHLSPSPPLHLSTSPPLYLSTSPPLHLSTSPPLHPTMSPRAATRPGCTSSSIASSASSSTRRASLRCTSSASYSASRARTPTRSSTL